MFYFDSHWINLLTLHNQPVSSEEACWHSGIWVIRSLALLIYTTSQSCRPSNKMKPGRTKADLYHFCRIELGLIYKSSTLAQVFYISAISGPSNSPPSLWRQWHCHLDMGSLTCCRECTQKMLYSLGLSRFGGCMPGLSIIMWQQIGLLIGPNKRRNSISISCVKQDVDGCKWETVRCSASSRSSSSVTLLVSSHFSLSFFTIRLFSELSVMLFKLSSFYHSTHQRSLSSSSPSVTHSPSPALSGFKSSLHKSQSVSHAFSPWTDEAERKLLRSFFRT